MSARRRDTKPHITVNTDEEAVQRWRKRSGEGDPGAHCVQVSLEPESVGSCNWPADRFPAQLQAKLHEEYVISYLQQKIGVNPTASNQEVAKHSWPIRVKDTQITATFKARGNQEDMLFMTPAANATCLPRKQLVKGEDVLRHNIISRLSLKPKVDTDRLAGKAKLRVRPHAALGAGTSFDDFKRKFVFPFSLRAIAGASAVDADEEFSAETPHSRHKIGKPPPLDLIAAHEKALRGASASAVKTDFGADVDVATLCCEGIPWNPFIAEDVELLAQGRKPFRASLDDFQRVQNMLVEVLPIKDLRARLGSQELQQLVVEVRSIGFSRLLARLCHFLCNKIMLRGRTEKDGSTSEWESNIFVKIHTTYAALYARLRRGRNSTLFQLPIVLLYIRAACETVFRHSYPDWAKTPAGRRVLRDIDSALTQLLDPDRWHSKISIFESSLDALKILRGPTVRGRAGRGKMTQQVYGTSPVIRSLFAGDKKSTFTKRELAAAANTPRRSNTQATASRTPPRRGAASGGRRASYSDSVGRGGARVAQAATKARRRGNDDNDRAHSESSASAQETTMLPMHVREQLYRTALQRISSRARKHGVTITRKGGLPMDDNSLKGSSEDQPYGSESDDEWLFYVPNDDESVSGVPTRSGTEASASLSPIPSRSREGSNYTSSWTRKENR